MIKEGVNSYEEPSFSLKNRLARLVWGGVNILFFRYSPRPFHSYRALILKMFGAKLGNNCHVYGSAKIWAPWNLILHDEACIANDTIIYNMAPITFGKKSIVSQGSHLCNGSHDYTDKNFQLFAKPITIGARAWLCTDCFVGPGVNIGNGTVVGARSVVVSDLEEWMVYAGTPAKAIKKRIIKN
ncbi:MAG: colanic acid biosynthesis acetyltransferase WcaF [Paraglaciecola sp.]|uniref:colanic acid biosynthesis acetyltransferase WcaF n=1 Tax=Paraglaciecola sp. TaxID=1920173 RepID=UPI0032992291